MRLTPKGGLWAPHTQLLDLLSTRGDGLANPCIPAGCESQLILHLALTRFSPKGKFPTVAPICFWVDFLMNKGRIRFPYTKSPTLGPVPLLVQHRFHFCQPLSTERYFHSWSDFKKTSFSTDRDISTNNQDVCRPTRPQTLSSWPISLFGRNYLGGISRLKRSNSSREHTKQRYELGK